MNFRLDCPFPRYWMCHAAVAVLIALVLWWPFGINAGLTAGGAFYAGREFTQWESGLRFDWKGLVAPLAAVTVAKAIWCVAAHVF